MKEVIKLIMTISILGGLIYLAFYYGHEGLHNISIVLLWVWTILLLIASLPSNKRAKQKNKPNIVLTIMVRVLWSILILLILYSGAFFMGAIWIFSTLVLISNKKD